MVPCLQGRVVRRNDGSCENHRYLSAPKDVAAFEKLYQEEHVPMAVRNLAGKTKIVTTKVVGAATGSPPFYRIAEIHFPSMEALQACVASQGAKDTLAHATSISSGGSPVVLIGEEEAFSF